jgi:hypothetical protein
MYGKTITGLPVNNSAQKKPPCGGQFRIIQAGMIVKPPIPSAFLPQKRKTRLL